MDRRSGCAGKAACDSRTGALQQDSVLRRSVDLALRTGGDIAFAIRKHSPKLKAELDAFTAAHREGTLFGNITLQKYLQQTHWAKNAVELEANIHGGVKYVRFMVDTYYKDDAIDPLDKVLFIFAAYNAGPVRVRVLRKEAASLHLDPNVWFDNVERVAGTRGCSAWTGENRLAVYLTGRRANTRGN